MPKGADELIIEALPKDMWFKNTLAWWYLKTLKGYSPGDAGEDIRGKKGTVVNTDGIISTPTGGKKI